MRHFSLLTVCVLLVWCGGCGSGDAPRRTSIIGNPQIALNDPNLYFSPYNWSVEGASLAITTQPGAYLTFGFQSANVRLNVDTSALASLPSAATPVLRWQIDSGPLQTYQLAAKDTQISLNAIPLGTGKHLCKLWFVASDYRQDRWNLPAEALRITGLTLDAGGTTIAPSRLPRRILFFGDSITEGARTESALNMPTRDDDATHAFPYTCAAALNAEFGLVGVSGQGWTIPGLVGSNVPPFTTAWTLEFAGKSRAFVPPPDYVIVAQGANDGNATVPPLQLSATVQSWLDTARAVMPTSRLCVVVPFSGFERTALTQAVQAYQAAHPSDKRVFLIDLPNLPPLHDLSGTPNAYSHDGFHPDAATSAAIGTQLAAAIQAVAP